MRGSGVERGYRQAATGLDVLVSSISALRAAVLSRVAFYRYNEFRFRLDAPHCVNQIASILSAQLEAKLAAHFAGCERSFVFS
jgi:hypothetical protein